MSTVYLEDSFIKSGVFSVAELVRVSRSKHALLSTHTITNTPRAVKQLFPSPTKRLELSLGGAELCWESHQDTCAYRNVKGVGVFFNTNINIEI